jgi:alpha-galactosidase
MRFRRSFLSIFALLGSSCFAAQSNFDQGANTWTLTNGWVRAVFQLTPGGNFLAHRIEDLQTGDQWTASPGVPTSPVRLQAGNEVFDAARQWVLYGQSAQSIAPSGVRQNIVLEDVKGAALITVVFEMYDNQPVLRYSLKYKNLTSAGAYITSVNMAPWTFGDLGKRYTTLRVNQWSVAPTPTDFQPLQSVLDPSGSSVEVYSGANGQQCGWMALRDADSRGLFVGWEFDGLAKTTARQVGAGGNGASGGAGGLSSSGGAGGYLELGSNILGLHHPVPANGEFQTPGAFLGLFHGDWDEAGYRTQRFVESVLAKPAPGSNTFPYVSWDSWAFQDKIDEKTLERNAGIAAAMGVQLFIVDLGWAKSIGDWHPDPAKFPNGLAVVADYVHNLGMKFGLHFALAEADPNSPVLRANPGWAATDSESYFGASPLCLSNQPAQDWLVSEGIRIVDEYKADWILQDGQNMVKQCTKTTHTHDPHDSNYANAVNGINAVVSRIQAARPEVLWENCENGGNMMTFNMVKSYVTSITNDASGALPARRALFGATYPFPPRYAERYMPASDGISAYATHSYRFGGPWVLMTQLTNLTQDQLGFLAAEIKNYKDQRAGISGGKVFHLLAPDPNGTDAIQSYNPGTDTAIAVVTRAGSSGPSYLLKPQGLDPNRRYTVWFETNPSIYSQTGLQITTNGIRVPVPTPYSSEIVHFDHR